MDDEKIAEYCREFGADVIMTSESFRNGTERCNEAHQKLGNKYDIIVNIQGDEPLVEPKLIDSIVKALQTGMRIWNKNAVFSAAVTSLKSEDAFDPNRVKCVVDNRGYAIYFSRGLIPFNKSGKVNPQFLYLLRLRIQSFDSKFLKIYPELPPTPFQLEEDLEQLKVLENRYKMKVIKVDHEAHGVDTPEDTQPSNHPSHPLIYFKVWVFIFTAAIAILPTPDCSNSDGFPNPTSMPSSNHGFTRRRIIHHTHYSVSRFEKLSPSPHPWPELLQ
ncbi:3-deoxy-manno-octulosonate cytidylyltransferase, mitochondrial [Olea europaea subsp. europaea]|uniref:3-deoxy-manno-octulosonate cytidylyltransferase, mitochondrial n=1 Tax=Olea europaea subsp. europaea TaxID=158383 RepID=A0A8S0QMR7_OLEEU|nr:3-deoxy-manno-octulosonate cytidylyltransferase, mitochondrial [Olea europaea subsp. europaea]